MKGGYLIYGLPDQDEVKEAVKLLEDSNLYCQVVDVYKGWKRVEDSGKSPFYEIIRFTDGIGFEYVGSLLSLKRSLT